MPRARIPASRRSSVVKSQRQRASQGTTLPTDRTAWSWLLGEPERQVLRPATPSEAEGLPAFGRGVELLASAVANTDWYAASMSDDGIWEPLERQPWSVIAPDPATDVWQWRYAATVDLVEYGNHISRINFADADTDYNYRPGSLSPQPIDTCSLLWEPVGGDPARWDYRWVIGTEIVPRDSVLHISSGNRSGEVLGRGAVRQYADALGFAVAAERYSAKWFAGGGLPPGIIRYQSQPTPAALTDFKDKWRELTVSGEVIAMPAGAELVPIASNAEQAQLVESRTWNAQLTAMILGIPSHLFGLPGTAMTYQNVESADIGWVRDTVDRWAQPIARAFSRVMLNRGDELRFDWAGRMRTDVESLANYVSTLKGAGLITVDEGRALLDLPPMTAAQKPPPPPPQLVATQQDEQQQDEGSTP